VVWLVVDQSARRAPVERRNRAVVIWNVTVASTLTLSLAIVRKETGETLDFKIEYT
jgi:hypothetical protein